MANKWDAIQEAFASNVAPPYTGMLPLLGNDLGVSDSSLNRLGIGYAPVVEFAKRPGQRFWTVPERDPSGKIVGMALRAESGKMKIMMPGSKHGLCYPVRKGFTVGKRDYSPGPKNWVRTKESGNECPVCHKPDGCLLSIENPEDPAAVLCIRESKGSTRPGNLDTGGWLHIRKPEGNLVKGGPLPESDNPVVIVEGMSDTAAALDLGLIAVGRPSNLAGLGYLLELVSGRPVIIVGENDLKADGRHPGLVGMEAAFETLRHKCAAVKVVPPPGSKDLREWKKLHDLTRESFLAYVEQHGDKTIDSRILESIEPPIRAEAWLRENHYQEGVYTLRKISGEWFLYEHGYYRPAVMDADIRGPLYKWFAGRKYKKEQEDGSTTIEPMYCDRTMIDGTVDAFDEKCPLTVAQRAAIPCWLDGRVSPSPTDLVVFPNGLFNVTHYQNTGEVSLTENTPTFFALHHLPYPFDPAAECPQWLTFLDQVFEGRPLERALLQEWFGYNLVPDVSKQKFMFFVGPPGSGKGTSLKVLEAMLGPSAVVSNMTPTLLGEKFGMEPLIGKLGVTMPDCKLGRDTDTEVFLERLLLLTGDSFSEIAVRKMRQSSAQVRVYARLTMAGNDFLSLPDAVNALERRALVIPFTRCFTKPDPDLASKLAKESSGIFRWALEGLIRLRYNGEFTEPPSSVESRKEFVRAASPLQAFAHECCEVFAGARIREDQLYDCWRAWAKDHMCIAGMPGRFAQNLKMNFSTVSRVGDSQNRSMAGEFVGVTLTQAAKDKYLK